ncbi:MAG: hypothetical protein LIP01_07550 [Tannerellaceae bacterium]|nr:hypothetical protein [Tannerellaceae bacterium]
MPYIKEKNFLLDLFEVYYSLEGLKYTLDFYLNMKMDSYSDIDSRSLALQYEYASKKDMHSYFELVLKSDKSRLFILNAPGAIQSDSFGKVRELTEEIIERIDKEYLK